jgi:CheY-like chemotaxis protein
MLAFQMDTEITTNKDILLVEDDPHDAELALAALEDPLANRVAVVGNGAEALDYLYRRGKFKNRAGGNPIVVVLDNKMPKVSGLEVLKIIKGDGHLKTIPVVALTSSRRTQDLLEFYEHGVNAYVVKSLEFSKFRAAIKQLVAFWAAVNEPPPSTGIEETSIQSDESCSPGKEEINNEAPAPHLAFGG